MITPDDVAKVVGDRAAGVANFTTYVPGGCFFDRGPDTPGSYPYVVFKLEMGDLKVTSGSAYVQNCRVRIAAYSPVGTGTPQSIALAFFECYGTQAANTALIAVAFRNATEKVLHCKPVNAPAAFDPHLRDGQDVFVVGLTFDLLLQGDRSVL